jgi:hypothetical protein
MQAASDVVGVVTSEVAVSLIPFGVSTCIIRSLLISFGRVTER